VPQLHRPQSKRVADRDDNPDDELAAEMRAELTSGPVRHVRYRREYLGWGVFALMNR
jgi:hypothetical protein